MRFCPSLAGVVLLRDRKQGLREAAGLPHHITPTAPHVSQQLCVLPTHINFRIKTQIKLMHSGPGCGTDRPSALNSGCLLDVCFLPFKLPIVKSHLAFQKLLRWLLSLSCSLKHSQAELESKQERFRPAFCTPHAQAVG